MNYEPPPRHRRILVDMDGTIVDTYGRFIKELNRRFSKSFTLNDMKSYDMTELGITQQQAFELFRTPLLHQSARELPYATESLVRLRKSGFQIHLATARNRDIQQETLNWIARYNVSFDSFHLIDNHFKIDPESKVRLVKKFNIGLAVDDAPTYINTLADYCDFVFAIETNYNKNEIADKSNIIRVKSVLEMTDLLLDTNSKRKQNKILDAIINKEK